MYKSAGKAEGMTEENKHFFKKYFKDILSLTEQTAIACYPHIGSGDRKQADQYAVDAMRQVFQKMHIRGQIVIGEGERDKAPMLYIGEKTGRWGEQDPEWDIAVDPLEGTNLCAKAINGAISVLAISEKGGLFNAPDVYMEKIACGPSAKGVIDLNSSVKHNLTQVSQALNKNISDMTVAVLDRSRHQNLIADIRTAGAKIQLIEDGDLSASLLTTELFSTRLPIDLMMGIGGAPEGVLSASALKCLGGDFQGRLVFKNEEEKQRAQKMGISDLNKVYSQNELVKKPVVFCATGVTDGALLKGVKNLKNGWQTESLYMESLQKQCSVIRTHHKKGL